MTSPPPVLPPPDDGAGLPAGVRVTGGAGGTAAHLEDLTAAAAALDRAADALDDAAREVLVLRDAVEDAAAWSPVTAPGARAALAPLLSSWASPRVVAAHLRDLAARVRASAELYAATDAAVAAGVGSAVRTTGVVLGGALGEAGPLGWAVAGALGLAAAGQAVVLTIGGAVVRAVPSPAGLVLGRLGTADARAAAGPLGMLARGGASVGLVGGGPGWPDPRAVQLLTPGVAALLRSSAPGLQAYVADPVPGAARTLRTGSSLLTALVGAPRPGLVVAPLVRADAPRGPGTDPPRPASSADLLRQVHALYPHPDDDPRLGTGGVPGTVGVQQLDHADGSRTWVVAVPGTEEWSPVAGPNPFDLTSNFDLVGGTGGDALRTVVEAMDQAGVEAGEPVVLAGHSQGGIVAATIAADPDLAERFTVAAVVTAGTPASGIDLPPGVPALHLEHAPDYVPTLDGAATAATPDRTTVLVDLARSPDPRDQAAAASPVSAHGVDAYARTADRLTGVGDPSVDAFEATLGRLLGDDATTVTSRRYVGVRVPAAS
ncbi:hypothetical protein [Actinotalea solisilvae]|uniref:hypothetical protein n=1 Tax=Actinotalea solisilvae TaxID=2072922 RepID=UPI0018F1B995|nr:hypothetical protein [Actinotalea solisilvae]